MTTAIARARRREVTSGMSVGQACEPSFTSVTRARAHSGRWKRYMLNGSEDGGTRREAGEQPRPARWPVPQLRQEVGERQEQERQRRVVVVLERRPVDARPGDPLDGEGDRDQRQGRAPTLERLPGHEAHRRDASHQATRLPAS